MNIYLDNSATTRVRDEVLNEIIDMNKNYYGNPSSLHRMGLEAEKKVENARKIIADFLKVKPNEIYFTGGGTESNNIAILGHLSKAKKGDNIITTTIEHPSVYNVYKNMEQKGIKVNYLDVDNKGFIDIDKLINAVDCNTKLLSIIMVNNEIGTIQEIQKIISIVKKRNKDVRIHIDGIQAFGKIDVDLNKLDIDTFSFSSHKIHGPKGIGGLYINTKSKIKPVFYGGNQEKGIRVGTENTAGIVGFGKAVELLKANFNEYKEKLLNLKITFTNSLIENVDDICINSFLDDRCAPHILSVSFKDVKGEILVHYLEEDNIYVSTGSACTSKGQKISRILEAIELDSDYIEGTLRISFGYFNKIEEINYVIIKIKEAVQNIREIVKR